MSALKTILGVVVFVILLLLLTSLYTINQGEHGLQLRLGRLVTESGSDKVKIFGPGLHVKMPFVENARIFDTRIQTLDIKSSRIVTREKKDVLVDYYVKWRIDNLAKYFKSTGGNELKAETLLEQQLNTSLRNQFGKRTIPELVSGERDDVMDVLRETAEVQASQLGIYVVDVRIKGIELPASTSNAIYQRMRADMKKIANRHRADGKAAAEAIEANADAKVTVILSTALNEGRRIKAQGQAKAATLYEQAFGKNKEFFDLYRNLKAYEGSFNSKQDILVLDPNNAFFGFFNQGIQKADGNNVNN